MSHFLRQTGSNIAVILLMLLTGCSFVALKKETKTLSVSTVLAGRVTSTCNCEGYPVVVAAYSKKGNSRTIANYRVLLGPSPYELMVDEGDYFILAFADKNHNLAYDEGEPAGQYLGSAKFSASPGGVVGYLDIVINPPEKGSIDFPVGTKVDKRRFDRLHYTSPGVIADLADPLFADEYASMGYWQPVEFFKEIGGNIYFLEDYDPNKIPLLFVHGACGSPRGWQPILEHIDRNKYQPWLFYYPSGARIESMSYLLF